MRHKYQDFRVCFEWCLWFIKPQLIYMFYFRIINNYFESIHTLCLYTFLSSKIYHRPFEMHTKKKDILLHVDEINLDVCVDQKMPCCVLR